MAETLWDAITRRATDFIEGGQERRKLLDDLGRKAEYYVPPELRNILGFVAEATPTAAIDRAAQAGGEMLAPGRTPMQRLGSAGEMLSETAGVVAPAMVANRAALPAAQAIQESLLGASMAADDVGRRFVERMNQPGPVPTMYSNPVGRAAGDGIEATLRAKYPDAKIYISGDASRGYTLSQIELPKNMRNSGVGSNIMQDFVSMADAQGAKINLTPSKAFGGSVARLKDFYKRFGFVENKGKNKDFSTRETMYREPSAPTLPAPRNEAEAMAKQVLEMRAAGRAGDVTEEMMAAADPQYMFANTPLPMDEASRMARARELGFDARVYHGSRDDITSMDPLKGSAEGGAGTLFSSDEARVANTYATKRLGSEGENVIPLLANVSDYGESGYKTPFPFNGSDVAIEQWLTGLDRFNRALDNSKTSYFENAIRSARNAGQAGTVIRQVEDDAVSSMRTMPSDVHITLDPTTIRSRFARFDPEFSHLRNLSAGIGGLGILSLLAQQEQEVQ